MIDARTTQSIGSKRTVIRSLFWKEVSEGKAFIAWSAAIMFALFVGDIAIRLMTAEYGIGMFDSSELCLILVAVWFLSAALSSSSTVSPEIGASSLLFLSSLPISRHAIWRAKTLSALIIHLISITVVTILFLAMYAMIAKSGRFSDHHPFSNLQQFFDRDWSLAAATLPVFALGTFVTLFTDRTLSAFFITGILSALAAMGFGASTQLLTAGDYWAIWIAVAAFSFALIDASYQIFLRGETLKTRKRYSVLINVGLQDILPIAAAVILSYIWIVY